MEESGLEPSGKNQAGKYLSEGQRNLFLEADSRGLPLPVAYWEAGLFHNEIRVTDG